MLDSVRAAACATRCDVVSGVVFDSLLNEPLAGAVLTAFPSGLTTLSDSLGRFALVSDEPITRLVAFHEVLDRIGLGGLEVRRRDHTRPWTSVQLATPSLLALWPRLCGERRPANARATVIMGTARLADDRTRVAGARVVAQWPRPNYAIGGGDPRTLDTITDSLGNFLLCGVEEYVEPALVAVAAEVQSGVIRLPSEARPVRRVDLVLGPSDASARGVLRGRVVNEQDAPVPNVRVGVDGVDEEVITGEDGRFVLLDVPVGSRMLWTRALGFSPTMQAVEVLTDPRPSFTIPLQRVIELEGVTVTARSDVRAARVDFEWRKRAGFARFLDSTAIMRVPYLRNALAELPSLRVRAGREANSFVITGRNECPAHIYLDGVKAEARDVWELPRELMAAVEVYSSVAFAPAQLVRVAADNCAVVAFWTKWALRP